MIHSLLIQSLVEVAGCVSSSYYLWVRLEEYGGSDFFP